MTHTADPVPDPAARHTARYDTDPDALAWARAKVQHYIDRLAAFEQQATESSSSNKARGLRVARRSAEQTLIGGEGCVVGAFDERRPVMFAPAAEQPVADTLSAWLRQRFTASGVAWEDLDDGERSYWEHEAAAVRRAVARGGFKSPMGGEQA